MTAGGKNNNCKEKPLLLLSALDWGLGHTTRTVPLVRELLDLDCEIVIACNSIQKKIYESEFNGIRFVNLEGYDLSYGSRGWSTKLKIGLQLRKILTRIKAENRWLKRFLQENKVSALISDNRYGLSNPGVYSVFITHQLGIKTGFGKVFDKICQVVLYRYINRFSECWVPDFSSSGSLAGQLSHPQKFPFPRVHYLGALSRFEACDERTVFLYDVIVVLSGPEPQRTILENIMLEQLPSLQIKIAFVRGLPGKASELTLVNGEVYNYPDPAKLNQLICSSRIAICRSGYSTVMDMIKLRKKMIVIPTPGQTEQQYLGKYLGGQRLALNIPQHQFDLKSALDAADSFEYVYINSDMNGYKSVLRNFVNKISS